MTADENTSPPFYKSPWVWGFIIGAVALTALRPLQDAMLRAPPPLAEVGAWTLVDDSGKAFGSEDLKGKVYVANFMFTRCRSICLDLTKAMKEVAEKTTRHGDALQLVSFTVDPGYDTPEKLRAYRKKFEADSPRWTYVTGEVDAVHELIAKRMPFHVGEIESSAADESSADKSAVGKPAVGKSAKPTQADAKSPDADDAKREGAAEEKAADEKAAAEAALLAKKKDDLIEIAHTGKLALFDQAGDLRAVFSTDVEGLAALGNAASLLIKKGPTP